MTAYKGFFRMWIDQHQGVFKLFECHHISLALIAPAMKLSFPLTTLVPCWSRAYIPGEESAKEQDAVRPTPCSMSIQVTLPSLLSCGPP